jgi:hypothetical protein
LQLHYTVSVKAEVVEVVEVVKQEVAREAA